MYWSTHNIIVIANELGDSGLKCHSAHSDSVNHLEYMTPRLLWWRQHIPVLWGTGSRLKYSWGRLSHTHRHRHKITHNHTGTELGGASLMLGLSVATAAKLPGLYMCMCLFVCVRNIICFQDVRWQQLAPHTCPFWVCLQMHGYKPSALTHRPQGYLWVCASSGPFSCT